MIRDRWLHYSASLSDAVSQNSYQVKKLMSVVKIIPMPIKSALTNNMILTKYYETSKTQKLKRAKK